VVFDHKGIERIFFGLAGCLGRIMRMSVFHLYRSVIRGA
jgi:hypothetical protein